MLPLSILAAAFSVYVGHCFTMGFNMGVLNQPSQYIKVWLAESYSNRYSQHYDVTSTTIAWSWVLLNSALYAGALFGSLVVGILADGVGRIRAMALLQLFSLTGSALFVISYHLQLPEVMIFSRLVLGVYAGFSGSFGPLFLSEMSPVNCRGKVVIGQQVMFSTGIFVSSVLGMKELLGTPQLWYLTILGNVVCSVICLAILPFIYDSPRYIMLIQKDTKGATEALKFYRGNSDVTDEMKEMTKEGDIDNDNKDSYTIGRVLTSKALRTPLVIGVMLQVIQQLTGINGIIFYSVGVYKDAGLPSSYVQYSVALTNMLFVCGVIVSVPFLDRIGRKPLFMYSNISMVIAMLVLTISLNLKTTVWMPFVSVMMLLIYVVGFGIGMGGLPLMVSAELFLQNTRPCAMAIIGATLWACVLVIALLFEYVQDLLKDQTFILFAFMVTIFAVYIEKKVPETKNKTFEEINQSFNDDINIPMKLEN